MDFIPDYFANVPVGTFAETTCSPMAPSGGWNGVRIETPREVRFAAGERPVLPICGYYLVPVLTAMDDGGPMIVELTRASDETRLEALVAEEGENEPDMPPDDAPQASRESLQGVSTGGYFNIDAQRYLAEPLAPDRYEVVVTYAGTRSNPVQVEIVKETGGRP